MDENHINNLKDSLDRTHEWPSVYVFKFIMPTVPDNREVLLSFFTVDVEISSNISKNAKYTSITIKEVIFKSEEVLKRYAGANKIEGLIAL